MLNIGGGGGSGVVQLTNPPTQPPKIERNNRTARSFFIAVLRTSDGFSGRQGCGGLLGWHTTTEASTLPPHQCDGGGSCSQPLLVVGRVEYKETSSAQKGCPTRCPSLWGSHFDTSRALNLTGWLFPSGAPQRAAAYVDVQMFMSLSWSPLPHSLHHPPQQKQGTSLKLTTPHPLSSANFRFRCLPTSSTYACGRVALVAYSDEMKK